MLVYLGLAEHLRVPWLVWENVPGVLSSNGGRDFGTFLGALGQLGYRWSYRVLDAQYFGVPQRRRRVFVVASLGNGRHPGEVLFEPEILRGHSAPRRKAREGVARGARQGTESGGRVDAYRMTAFGQYEDDDSASTCKQRDHKDATDRVVTATGPVSMRESGPGYWMEDTVSGTLRAEGEDRPSRPSHVVAFHPTPLGDSLDPISSTDATHALGTGSKGGCATVAVATPTMAVRRLLPVECERLQGFPDDHTLISWKGKPASECPDGPRYKAMGNSMAVPVMRWIGTRLDALVKGTL